MAHGEGQKRKTMNASWCGSGAALPSPGDETVLLVWRAVYKRKRTVCSNRIFLIFGRTSIQLNDIVAVACRIENVSEYPV